jgi:hypothetical protein
MKHLDVISSGIFADEVPDKHPHMWAIQDMITLGEAMKVYMVEVIA